MKNYVVTFDLHDDSLREDFKSILCELGLQNMEDNQTTYFGAPNSNIIYIDNEETMAKALKMIYEKESIGRTNKIDKISFYYPLIVGYVAQIRHLIVIDREQ